MGTSIAFSQDFALAQLENSPRHHEWQAVEVEGRKVQCFVAYPEKSRSTPVVIVIHENRGLNAWARSLADQVAEAGYLAVAPDLLSGCREGIEKTTDFASSDEARKAIYQLDQDFVTKALYATHDMATKLPACNGKSVVMGFCWGGSQSFRLATNNQDLEAALVFYGTAPKDDVAFTRINAPVYGFYGENDQRVNATISRTDSIMASLGKPYKYEIYPGAGHAFMRRGDDPKGSQANRSARDAAWKRFKKIMKKI